jgi:hypothetical protein
VRRECAPISVVQTEGNLEPKADIFASGYRIVWLGGSETNRTFVGAMRRSAGAKFGIDRIITRMGRNHGAGSVVKTLDEP